MKEWVELYNLRTNHVVIQSELKYLIGAKDVMLKCRVLGGKTGPFPVDRVFRVVRPIPTVRFPVESEPEPTREIGPVANTIHNLHQFGCYPSRLIPKVQRLGKFRSKSKPCMIVGYTRNPETFWRIWNCQFQKVNVESEVIIGEESNAHISSLYKSNEINTNMF